MKTFKQFIENRSSYVSSDELVDLAKKLHHKPEDFDEGDLEQRIKKHSFYILQDVPLDKIDAEMFYSDNDLVKEYEDEILKNQHYPPIILGDDHIIIDGTHRAMALKNLGHSTIKAYVPVKS